MLSYSIAIRTLGTSGDMFREELLSIAAQTVQPERVMIYIAEGYARPAFSVGREEYVWVKKGMVAQRCLPCDDISSDVIFLLDDDVRLAPDSAERMLKAMEMHDADCIGADTFKNHNMSEAKKVYAAVTNLVFPHCSDRWAFKVHKTGSFSYNNRPTRSLYLSQSCAGNAIMLRRSVYESLHFEDERWLDELLFAYGDDMVESYKIFKNGYRLGVVYDSGCEHLDAGSVSSTLRRSIEWMHTRAMSSFIIWWRIIYEPAKKNSFERLSALFCFAAKSAWVFLIMCAVSVMKLSPRYAVMYLRGLRDGRRFVLSDKFRALNPYILR